MSALDTLKDQLDAAWDEIQDSALSRELARKEQRAWDANKPVSRPYLRLEKLHAAIAETAALLADDDITKMITTIANEKDKKMNKYEIGLKGGTVLIAYGMGIGADTKEQFFGVSGHPDGRTAVALSEVAYWIETEDVD